MADTAPYNILDFKAVVKHAFYGASSEEALHCEETDRTVNTWEAAAQFLLERYADPLTGEGATPRHLLVCHDMGRDYRTAVFEGYKQKRTERERSPVEEEQLAKLNAWSKAFFAAIGATQIGVEGVEADDVIAWLCQGIQGPKQVFTVDADLLQLVNEDTLVYLKLEPHMPGGEHKGVPYHLTSIAKSMLGDSSDCYGGVPQLGPAKFQALVAAYGEDGIEQLRDIIEHGDPTLLDQAIEATGDKTLIRLRDHFSTWQVMWKLAKLHPELCWKPRGRKLVTPVVHKRIANGEKVRALLAQAGADDLWPRFEPMMPRFIAVTADNWDGMRAAIFDEIAAGDVTAFDYETDDKDPNPRFLEAATGDSFVDMLSHELTGAAFTFGRHLENTIYVTVDHKDAPNLPRQVIAELLEHAGRHTQLVVQNALFEGVISQTNLGLKLQNVHDTRIMQRYFNENMEAGLKAMSKHYLGYNQKAYQETVGDKSGMSELTLEEVFGYGVDDGIVTGALYDLLKVMLQVDRQWDFYRRWAVRATEVLQHSYINGVDVNWKLQMQVHEDDKATVASCTAELRRLLEVNVTGEVTAGCRSYLEAEGEYMRKKFRRELRDKQGLADEALGEAVRMKLSEWRRKFEESCQYLPYSEEWVMPKFSPTPKQLGEAAESLGLPPVEKTSVKYLTEYLIDQGLLGQGAEPQASTSEQAEFLHALLGAFEAGSFGIKKLETDLDKAYDEEDEKKSDRLEKRLEAAREAFESLGAVVQKACGVEPKLIATGDPLSFGSPQQMQQLIYCKIGVPVRLRSSGTLSKGRMLLGFRENGPATDEDAIKTALANDVEAGSWQEQALKLLMSAKSALTKIQLYHNKWPLWIHHVDGKVHPSFTDAGTDTRRPTGSAPNMLQVSKKDKVMRQMFLPPTRDHVVVAIDYASQEIRLMACEADDPVMKSVYDPANEKDLHSMTGSGIAKMDYDQFIEARLDADHKLHPLVEAMRKKAKACIAEGSPVLTDQGLVPIEAITRQHRVWDGVDFVEHDGLEYKGVQDVITVGPLTATPDHEVYLDDGRTIPFGQYAAQQDGRQLAIGEIEGAPVGYPASDRRSLGGVWGEERGSDGHHTLHGLQGGEAEGGEQPDERVDQALQLPENEATGTSQTPLGALSRDGAALQQSEEPVVQELRGTGHHAGIQQRGGICGLDAEESPAPQLQGSGDRQNREPQGLRPGEPSASDVPAKPLQYPQESPGHLQGGRGGESSLVGPHQDGSPGVPLREGDGSPLLGERDTTSSDISVPTPARRRAKVYDIVNAGPRHRFTVSGVIVHNCNFGLAYGAGPGTLSRSLIVPQGEAQQLLDDTLGLYTRVRPWQEETAAFMDRHGFTLTAFGTKRHATDDLFSKDKGKRARQHRQGTNATIQGTAAEMLRIVLTKIAESGMLERLKMVFFAPIYDEVVSFVHRDDVVEYCREMRDIMSSATPPGHDIPQVPEFSIGATWGTVHELGRWPGEEAILAATQRALGEGAAIWENDMKEAA